MLCAWMPVGRRGVFMTKAKYEVFEALNPFFKVVMEGLRRLVDGNHYFDTIADEPLAIRKRYGVTEEISLSFLRHDKPVAFSCKVLRNCRSRKKWSDDENGIAGIQRRCRAGSRHRCVDERALR